MSKATVLLTDGTVGEVIEGDVKVQQGDTVTVYLHDENGMPIRASGTVAEVL